MLEPVIAFSACLDLLAEDFPNRNIRDLATLARRAYKAKYAHPTVIGGRTNLSTLSSSSHGLVVLIPTNWHETYENDPHMQLGSVVCMCSYIRDQYMHLPSRSSGERAKIYEAEYLLTLIEKGGHLNGYQKGVLKTYPQGVKDPQAKALVYESPLFVEKAMA